MIRHIGEIVYKAIKSKKYSIGYISKKIGITRNTLYKKLKKEDLALDFVIKIGNIIEYDFLNDVPELEKYAKNKNLLIFKNTREKTKMLYRIKYLKLLYQYNSLLDFMVTLADNHDLKSLKEDIKEFVKTREVH